MDLFLIEEYAELGFEIDRAGFEIEFGDRARARAHFARLVDRRGGSGHEMVQVLSEAFGGDRFAEHHRVEFDHITTSDAWLWRLLRHEIAQ